MTGTPEDLVGRQWRPLLPTAYLMTGSDAAAAELVTRSLSHVRPARARAAGTDADAGRRVALEGLARACRGRWRPGEGTVTGATTTAWWVSEADAESARRLSAALDRLTPQQRLAVVLHHHEGLPVTDVGALLAVGDATGLLMSAERELAGEVPGPADLGRRLDGMAGLSDAQALDGDSARAGVRAHRGARVRRAAGTGAAVLALAAGAVLVPGTVSPEPEAAVPVTSAAPSEQDVLPFDAVYARTRGSLADDRAFLAQVLARDLTDAVPRATAGAPRVAFAGDVAGHRWVLLVDRAPDHLDGQWLLGPAGAAVEDLELLDAVRVEPGRATAAVGQRGGAPVVLVLALPGDEVAVSSGVDVTPEGTASRTYTDVPTTADGVASATLDRPVGLGVRFRTTRDGLTARPQSPGTSSPVGWPTTSDGSEPRSGSRLNGRAEESLVLDVLVHTGWSRDAVQVQVLGSGSFDGGPDTTNDVLLVAVTLPGGAVVVSAGYVQGEEFRVSTGTCGRTLLPAGTDLAVVTVVARCLLYAPAGATRPVLVVAAPPQVTSVTVGSSDDGRPAVQLQLVDGWGALIDAGVTDTATGVDAVLLVPWERDPLAI